MIDDNLPMSPTAGSLINVYDQNFNGLGTTVEVFNKKFEDERITRSKGKEVLNFSALSTSNIYQYLQTENIIEFGGRWFRIKYAEDDTSTKGLTHYDCYALWYELAEGTPTPLKEFGSTIWAVANSILEPFGKWVELVIPTELQNRSINSITLQENSALYKLRYLAKRFNLELTFGYREVIENELRYVKTVVFLQQYTESKIEFPLVVEENLKHIARTEDSRNLVTAYKISGKSENDEEEFTFAEINGGNDYLVDTSWFTSRGMRPRIIPKAKKDDRYTIKQSMLDAARSYLDIYAKPLVSYEASAILYEEIPNLHQSQLVIDDTYLIVEWRKVSSRKLNYDDLTSSIIVFDDPRQDLMDLLNDDGDGALSPTEESDSRTIIRYANDAMGNGFNDKSGDYIGVLVTKRKASELGPQDFSWQKIKGEEGPQGAPGRDGVDGIAGKDGVGIIETQVSYYLSTSGTTKPQTGWTEDVPPLVKGRYLWTRTIWRYSDGQLETGYSVAYVGQDGNNGTDGLPGKDGVGISSTSITYARSTSWTSAPSTGWTSAVPSVPAGEFLWTKTVWSYTDNTSETGYSVARMGADGTGLLTTWTFYKLSNSTSAPQVVPIGPSTNLGHLGPNNAWAPYKELSGGAEGWSTIDFDKIAKSDIIPDRPFTWYLEASFDGVSNFNGSTDFNIRFENWYVNSSGAAVYNSLGIRDFIASNFSATNDTTVNNYFSQSITWTVPREVYDAIPEGGFLNLRIRIDRFTKLSYRAKNSYVTYGTVPSDFTQRGLGNYSTYGWKASPEAVTQALPYLWIYQIQFYDNGREVAIPPTLIGTQGADGRTSYIHWAYSDNADGTGLTSSDNGQRYIGHYSDYMQEDSTDKTKYRWADRWAKIEAGNGNLLRWTTVSSENLKYFIKSDSATLSIEHKEGKNAYKIAIANSVPNTGNGAFFNSNENPDGQGPTFNLYPNCRHTFTFSVWSSVSIPFNYGSLGHHQVIGSSNVSGEIAHQHRDASWSVSSIKQGEWQRVSYSFTAISLSYFRPFFWYLPAGIEIYIADMMLSDGNIELPWEPSHLDLVSSIETKADQALTQQQLNMLIEKAQQMQTELEARAAMETLSDLERAYKAYVEANDKAVAKSQADLIEAGRRVDAMVETLGGLSKTKTFIETYIKEAEEGIIIGTNDNVSQIRVTYDRIAMYSAGKEVMYISQGVIHIDNGVFTKSLQIGRFRTEQHQTNLDINVCRYVG